MTPLLRLFILLSLVLGVRLVVEAWADDPPPIAARPDAAAAATAGGEKGAGSVGIQLGYYDNDDDHNDGNPFLDERLTVIEPVAIFDYNVTDRVTVWGQFSYDEVSSASIDRLKRFPNQVGASGDYYYGVDGGIRYKLSERTRVGGFLSASTEFDYDSYGFGGDLARDSADKNRTVKWGLNGFYDEIKIIRWDGTQNEGKDERLTLSTALDWYQIIDSKTHGELGTALTYQWGFLETAYNSVIIEHPLGFRLGEVTEELSDNRLRGAIYGRIRRYYPTKTAAEFGGRLYADDWGIASFAVEPSVHQWIVEESLNLKLRYRFYTQTAADDFKHHAYAVDRFRTQDADLGKFHSHSVGLQLNWYFWERSSCTLSSDFIFRSDGIDETIGSVGLRREFE